MPLIPPESLFFILFYFYKTIFSTRCYPKIKISTTLCNVFCESALKYPTKSVKKRSKSSIFEENAQFLLNFQGFLEILDSDSGGCYVGTPKKD